MIKGCLTDVRQPLRKEMYMRLTECFTCFCKKISVKDLQVQIHEVFTLFLKLIIVVIDDGLHGISIAFGLVLTEKPDYAFCHDGEVELAAV